MSSPRQNPVFDAQLRSHSGEPTGPIQLPMSDADRFVREFNDRYQAIGLMIESVKDGVDESRPNPHLIGE